MSTVPNPVVESVESARPLRAAIYVPTDLAERDLPVWRERCIQHCLTMGYDIETVVTGDARAWEQLHQELVSGAVQIVVVGRREHLPPQRLPRIEETGVDPTRHSFMLPPEGQRRPRRIHPSRQQYGNGGAR